MAPCYKKVKLIVIAGENDSATIYLNVLLTVLSTITIKPFAEVLGRGTLSLSSKMGMHFCPHFSSSSCSYLKFMQLFIIKNNSISPRAGSSPVIHGSPTRQIYLGNSLFCLTLLTSHSAFYPIMVNLYCVGIFYPHPIVFHIRNPSPLFQVPHVASLSILQAGQIGQQKLCLTSELVIEYFLEYIMTPYVGSTTVPLARGHYNAYRYAYSDR